MSNTLFWDVWVRWSVWACSRQLSWANPSQPLFVEYLAFINIHMTCSKVRGFLINEKHWKHLKTIKRSYCCIAFVVLCSFCYMAPQVLLRDTGDSALKRPKRSEMAMGHRHFYPGNPNAMTLSPTCVIANRYIISFEHVSRCLNMINIDGIPYPSNIYIYIQLYTHV